MSLESIIFITGKGSCVSLSELHRQKVEGVMGTTEETSVFWPHQHFCNWAEGLIFGNIPWLGIKCVQYLSLGQCIARGIQGSVCRSEKVTAQSGSWNYSQHLKMIFQHLRLRRAGDDNIWKDWTFPLSWAGNTDHLPTVVELFTT